MLSKVNLTKAFEVLLTLLFLIQPRLSYAYRGFYHYHEHPHFGLRVSIIPDGCFTVSVGGGRYYYYDGVYYNRIDSDYVIVAPPIGAVVSTIPADFQPVAINGVTYYVDNGSYYVHTLSGYQVVPPPETSVPVAATQPSTVQTLIAAPTPTTPGTVIPPQAPIASSPASPSTITTSDTDNTFTVNIPNDKGGYTAVLIKRSGKGFIGPQGEFYAEFPKVSQLKVMYGKE